MTPDSDQSQKSEVPVLVEDGAAAPGAARASLPPVTEDALDAASEAAPPAEVERFGWLPLALAAALPLAFFFVLPPLTKSGLWDPYELNVADLGRRIALNLFGADSLSLDGAEN